VNKRKLRELRIAGSSASRIFNVGNTIDYDEDRRSADLNLWRTRTISRYKLHATVRTRIESVLPYDAGRGCD